jgi:NAD(P)H-hydrate epimerase
MSKNIVKISSESISSVSQYLEKIFISQANSHKGENGRLLVVGGSNSFHAASIWAAEMASYMVDIVHYCSTKENNEIFLLLRSKFRNGIVIEQKNMLNYVDEDDAVLIGPGMERGKIHGDEESKNYSDFKDILEIKEEYIFTYQLMKYLFEKYPNKKYVIDAAGLQMLNPEWLLRLERRPILTPHQKEFEKLFSVSLEGKTIEEKAEIVKQLAKKYNCIILLKIIDDIVTDGEVINIVNGGNQGLTKGGTGDVLASLVASFYTKNIPLTSAVFSSFLIKSAADELYKSYGYWYNVSTIISGIINSLKKILIDKNI